MARKIVIKNQDGTYTHTWKHEEWERKGFRLKMYMNEHLDYPEFQEKIYATPKEAEKYLKKLKRHFKLPNLEWEFSKNSGGSAHRYWWGYKIKLPKTDITLGLICHEIAHVIAFHKYDTMGHTKKFYRQLKRVYTWAKRYL